MRLMPTTSVMTPVEFEALEHKLKRKSGVLPAKLREVGEEKKIGVPHRRAITGVVDAGHEGD